MKRIGKIVLLVVITFLVFKMTASAQWTTMDLSYKEGFEEAKNVVVHAPEYAEYSESGINKTLGAWIYAHHFNGEPVFVFNFYDLNSGSDLEYSGESKITISSSSGEYYSCEFEGLILQGVEAERFNKFILQNEKEMKVEIKQSLSKGTERKLEFTISSSGLEDQLWFNSAS